MWQFKSHTILLAVNLIVISHHYIAVVYGIKSTSFNTVKIGASDSQKDDSNLTIVYSKEDDDFRIVPLISPQLEEVLFVFDTQKDVQFELFTPQNPNRPDLLTLGNYTTVKKSHFKWWRQTRILIHGW